MRKYIYQHLLRNWPIFVLLVIVCLHFLPIIINPNKLIFPGYDIVDQYLFWKRYLVETVMEFHELPFWNPYTFSGTPFIGDPLSALFYPMNIIYFILPLIPAINIHIIIDFVLIALGSYWFARLNGLQKTASLVSSISFSFSATLIVRVYAGHISNLDAISWYPITMAAYHVMIKRKTISSTIAAGIPIGFMFLSGNVHFATYGLIGVLMCYGLYLLQVNLKNITITTITESFLLITIPVITGSLIAAAQLLPSWDFSQVSNRGGSVNFLFASSYALHPLQIISFLIPGFFGLPHNNTYWGPYNIWEICGYIGFVPLSLAFFGIFHTRHPLKLPLILTALFALLFSLGKSTPLFYLLYHTIPLFQHFRIPATFLFVYAFCASFLAGLGMEKIITAPNIIIQKYIKKITIICTIFIFMLIPIIIVQIKPFSIIFHTVLTTVMKPLIINYTVRPVTDRLGNIDQSNLVPVIDSYFNNTQFISQVLTEMSHSLIVIASVTSIFSLIFSAFSKKRLSINSVKILLILLIVGELYIFNARFIRSVNQKDLLKSSPLIEKIPQDNGKLLNISSRSGYELQDAPQKRRIESATGYNALYLRRQQEFLWEIGQNSELPYDTWIKLYTIDKPELLRVAGIRYIITSKPLYDNSFQLLYKEGNDYLYELTNTLSKVYISSHAIPQTENNVLRDIVNTTHNPQIPHIITDIKIPFSGEQKNTITPLSTEYSSPNKIIINIPKNISGYLVVNDSWYPYWEATIDSLPAKIHQANYIAKSVFIPKGSNQVVFNFIPKRYIMGITISGITLLVAIFNLLLMINHGKIKKKQLQ